MTFLQLKGAAVALALSVSPFVAHAQDWEPSGPIKMSIAFQAGGGVDTLGRLLAEELSARNGWEIIPENAAGKGGGVMAAAMVGEPNDGLSIGVTVDEAMTYGVQAARNPGYALDDFTYISTITGTQMAVIAQADRGWTTLGDVIAAAQAGESITFAAMSPMLTDAIYIIGKNNDVEFTPVSVQGGKGGLNAVVAEDVDIAFAAGVQTPGVLAGDLVNLVSGEEGPLRISPDAPMMSDFNVPYIFGSKFIVVAPAGMPEDIRVTYENAIAEILNDPESKVAEFASRAFSGPIVVQGEELEASVQDLYESYSALLEDTAE
ncbi:tripartite tricarboxylate transporter substrate-binding protein [Tritonibacter mobilis]|nr:tripartite tricarboxylate transporter substrate-binding protein [Tritonibacter mobilis]